MCSSVGNAVVNPGVFESEISNSPSQCTRQCALTWLLHICCAMRRLDQRVPWPIASCSTKARRETRPTAHSLSDPDRVAASPSFPKINGTIEMETCRVNRTYFVRDHRSSNRRSIFRANDSTSCCRCSVQPCQRGKRSKGKHSAG